MLVLPVPKSALLFTLFPVVFLKSLWKEPLQRSLLHGSLSTGFTSLGGLNSFLVAGGVSILSESISILSIIFSSSAPFFSLEENLLEPAN